MAGALHRGARERSHRAAADGGRWGRALEAEWQTEVDRRVEDLPPVPLGPPRVVVSVDGAMVPLRGGEVKPLVVGEAPPVPLGNRTPSSASDAGGALAVIS
jgi:hypothetical protein